MWCLSRLAGTLQESSDAPHALVVIANLLVFVAVMLIAVVIVRRRWRRARDARMGRRWVSRRLRFRWPTLRGGSARCLWRRSRPSTAGGASSGGDGSAATGR